MEQHTSFQLACETKKKQIDLTQLTLFNKIYLVVPYIFGNFAHRNLRIVQE